jgi:hypothetical protein
VAKSTRPTWKRPGRGKLATSTPTLRGYLDFWEKPVKPANPHPPGTPQADAWETGYKKAELEFES